MSVVHGTYRKGHIDIDEPVDWAEGERVSILRADSALGVQEETWVDTPEARAALVASMDDIEPLEMTPEEEAEWKAALDAVGE